MLGGLRGLLLGVALYVTRRGGILANAPRLVVLNVLVNIFRPIPFIIFIAAVQPLARAVSASASAPRRSSSRSSLAAAFAIGRIVEQNLADACRPASSRPRARWAPAACGSSVRSLIPEALGPLILGYTFIVRRDRRHVGDGRASSAAAASATSRIVYGYRQFNPVVTWAAVLVIVVIVQLVQFVGNALARKVLRR